VVAWRLSTAEMSLTMLPNGPVVPGQAVLDVDEEATKTSFVLEPLVSSRRSWFAVPTLFTICSADKY
jgi:hypothetical protein